MSFAKWCDSVRQLLGNYDIDPGWLVSIPENVLRDYYQRRVTPSQFFQEFFGQYNAN